MVRALRVATAPSSSCMRSNSTTFSNSESKLKAPQQPSQNVHKTNYALVWVERNQNARSICVDLLFGIPHLQVAEEGRIMQVHQRSVVGHPLQVRWVDWVHLHGDDSMSKGGGKGK
jgi:hypothetical protein